MDNTKLLLRMMEQPNNYTDQQWNDILADPECRELYMLMAKTQSAFDLQHDISDEEINTEWERLQSLTSHPSPQKRHFSPLKLAASFIGLLLVSGIALAAIHFTRLHQQPVLPKSEQTTAPAKAQLSTPQREQTDTIATAEPVVFDNVSLDKIVGQIAACHHLGMEVENERARQLRFYFVWKKESSLQTVVDQLNQFESINIVVKDNKLIVK